MCDMVWSDPEEIDEGWLISPRGAGYLFGERYVCLHKLVLSILLEVFAFFLSVSETTCPLLLY